MAGRGRRHVYPAVGLASSSIKIFHGRRTATAAVLALGVAAALATPARAADRPGVTGTLLTGGSGSVTQALDVSETGFVTGTSTQPYADSVTAGGQALRWLVLPNGRTATQTLRPPAGVTGASVRDVNAVGEVSGTVGLATGGTIVPRALRWSVTGTASTWLSGPNSTTVGGGETGWVVQHPSAFIFGTAGFVDRNNTETALNDTPELKGATTISAVNVAADRTALLEVVTGFGRTGSGRWVLYKNAKSQALPVVESYFLVPACVTELLPNGSVAYQGFNLDERRGEFGIHRGGVGGTNTLLPVPADRFATMDCRGGGRDFLALDGTTGGALQQTDGFQYTDGAVWRNDQLTVIPRRGDERILSTVAVASGGRAVIRALTDVDPGAFYYWKAGVRQPLNPPAGWQVRNIVALTETGLVIGNVVKPGDETQVRPVVWRTGS